ncbi:MAG: MurR/RpiR family transcriptional regulator [Aerococcus sp.]|nr:MurR/RpiR family transcriptional regulator [Aerococcus sp.]
MLIYEKMQTEKFSEAEQLLVNYMLEHPEHLNEMTVSEMAKATHTNATSLIRVAKKLGFDGWRDLRRQYLEEWETLSTHFNDIDVNIPFSAHDDPATVAKKLATVEMEAIQETRQMLNYEDLVTCQHLLQQKSNLLVFANFENRFIGHSLVEKTRRIGLNSALANNYGLGMYEAYLANPTETLAVMFSYTGEGDEILRPLHILKQRGIPVIAITSMGDNSLEQDSTVALRISTHERLFSKISTFSTNLSMKYLSDLLYSLYFMADYNHNWHTVLRSGERWDHRLASTSIIEGRGVDHVGPF